MAFFNALLIDIYSNDIAGGLVEVGLEKPYLFKAHVHQSAGGHDEVQNSHGQQLGQIDIFNALEHGSAIDFSRLVEAGIHVGQGGQIDDAAPAGVLPNARSDVDGAEGGGLGEKVDAGAEDQVNKAARGAQEDGAAYRRPP